VSCSPAYGWRADAAELVQVHATRQGAGVMNMFPQTSQVESIALFEKDLARMKRGRLGEARTPRLHLMMWGSCLTPATMTKNGRMMT